MRASSVEAMAREFRVFAEHADQNSPLYALLSASIAEDEALLTLAAEAQPGQPLPNMLLAAAHALLLGGLSHPAARFYPSVGGTEAPGPPAFAAFRELCLSNRAAVAALLRSRRTQTNETQRCAYLLPAFGVAAGLGGGRPLALIEIGPSAGLNMAWDRYSYDYGVGPRVGEAGSPVRLSTELRGSVRPPIPPVPPAVAWRVGVELEPVDLEDAATVRWLEALVWPEQTERVARLRAAIEEARRRPPRIVAGDALALLPELIAQAPAGATLCVYHTHVTYQFTPEQRVQLDELLAAAGRERPLLRLGCEGIGKASPSLVLSQYAGNRRDDQLLATVAGHGNWIAWKG